MSLSFGEGETTDTAHLTENKGVAAHRNCTRMRTYALKAATARTRFDEM